MENYEFWLLLVLWALSMYYQAMRRKMLYSNIMEKLFSVMEVVRVVRDSNDSNYLFVKSKLQEISEYVEKHMKLHKGR